METRERRGGVGVKKNVRARDEGSYTECPLWDLSRCGSLFPFDLDLVEVT